MQRRTDTTLLLLVVVVLAGCNGFSLGSDSGGTPEPTLTPAAVPTDEPTPTAAPQLAPGLTGGGVTDPSVLAAAHAAVLNGSAYSLRRGLTVRYANGSLHARQTIDARIVANRTQYYVVQNVSGAIVTIESSSTATYSDGERLLVARTLNGQRTYGVPRDIDQEPAPARELFPNSPIGDERIEDFFTAVETRVVGERTENGTTHYRLVGTDVADGTKFEKQFGNPRSVTARAIVDSQGIVHEYRLRYEGTLDGANVTVFRRARYTGVGATTVERPPWYEAAVRNITAVVPNTTRERNAAPPTAVAAGVTLAIPNAAVSSTTSRTTQTVNPMVASPGRAKG